MVALRREVLGMYRNILRVARGWEAQEGIETKVERNYIIEEARCVVLAGERRQNMCNFFLAKEASFKQF